MLIGTFRSGHMLRKTLIFLSAAGVMHVAVLVGFGLICWVNGHTMMEAIYGAWLAITFPIIAGIEAVYLSTLP